MSQFITQICYVSRHWPCPLEKFKFRALALLISFQKYLQLIYYTVEFNSQTSENLKIRNNRNVFWGAPFSCETQTLNNLDIHNNNLTLRRFSCSQFAQPVRRLIRAGDKLKRLACAETLPISYGTAWHLLTQYGPALAKVVAQRSRRKRQNNTTRTNRADAFDRKRRRARTVPATSTRGRATKLRPVDFPLLAGSLSHASERSPVRIIERRFL